MQRNTAFFRMDFFHSLIHSIMKDPTRETVSGEHFVSVKWSIPALVALHSILFLKYLGKCERYKNSTKDLFS